MPKEIAGELHGTKDGSGQVMHWNHAKQRLMKSSRSTQELGTRLSISGPRSCLNPSRGVRSGWDNKIPFVGTGGIRVAHIYIRTTTKINFRLIGAYPGVTQTSSKNGQNWAKIHTTWPINRYQFRIDYNFLPSAVINLIFWLVIWNFPTGSIDIDIDLWSGHNDHYGHFSKMAVMARLNMAKWYLYWKFRKIIDHQSKN